MEHGKPSSSAFPCVKSGIEAQFRQVFGATRNQSKAPYMDLQPCDLRIQILTTAPPLQLFISTTDPVFSTGARWCCSASSRARRLSTSMPRRLHCPRAIEQRPTLFENLRDHNSSAARDGA